jgi:hypothetical protein
MLHLGWIAVVIFVAWRIAFALLKRRGRQQ